MVLFDVTLRVTDIPMQMVLDNIRRNKKVSKLSIGTPVSQDDIMILVELGMETYLQFGRTIYNQIRGKTIKLPLPGLSAYANMKQFETKIFKISCPCLRIPDVEDALAASVR